MVLLEKPLPRPTQGANIRDRRGLDTRIGLEDTLLGPNGKRTTGNEALVCAAREFGAGID
jgi:hypothetical protein